METLRKAVKSSLIILKYVVPIYILADILYYFNILSYISFLFEPFTALLDLPKETSLAIISGMFLNLYAAVAFAAPLDLTPKEWSVLAIFLGVCHSLLVESAILKKIGISVKYSFVLRITGGFVIAYLATFLPDSLFTQAVKNIDFKRVEYSGFFEMVYHSLINALVLSLKIIILITVLIFFMEGIKKLLKNFNVSKTFSIIIGLFLGITYGAAVLIEEAKNLKKSDIFYIATFLSICHSVVEDTLLFVIFGANFWVVVIFRLVFAFVLAFFLTKLFFKHT